ncbi:alpha-galactosidase [Phaeacidiphilus oryzae]|uniref:alpha-galactosidase n=1 Tax=Phaeacidiphilus oryzae TaxID=348818 RepID=UPI000560BBBF|nr:alpha-galactosidase [Phaeacidiphilus oryzae]
MATLTAGYAYLRAAGTSLVVALTGPLPHVLHWGADLGALTEADCEALDLTGDGSVLNNALDVPRRFSVWPTEADGWSGTPAHEGHLAGGLTAPRLRLSSAEQTGAESAGGELVMVLADDAAAMDITLTYNLTTSGVLTVRSTLTRRPSGPDAAEAAPYDLAAVTALLPLPRRATEILDFTGKWSRERAPQRRPLAFGTHLRAARRGKSGVDSPYLLTVGVPGFGFRHGEVWGVHVAWSGDQRYLVEQLPEGAGGVHAAVLGGGEQLRPGEVRLAPGESHRTPVCHFAWSDAGLDGLADRFHEHLRARPAHPRAARPLVLNTWEAVYFDHDSDRLLALADRAAQVGVERFVLDDGWFRGRRSDTAGLGDWTVDPDVWPDGLTPVVERVRAHGMQFGLWVEPEMVNLDSRLAREHPDWILGPAAGLGASARNQYALDLSRPEVWNHLLAALDALVGEYAVDFLKWDHNREIAESVHYRAGRTDAPAGHRQVDALYRLLDALRERHPALEVESCASGGGRVDLGILEHTDRVWPSDCNDPVERQVIQRWTGQLLPPELVGTHVGAALSHTTGRLTADSFRLATALFGHAGIEQDLNRCDAAELERLTSWSALYREFRGLLHSGRSVRADLDEPDSPAAPADPTGQTNILHGVVSRDGTHALMCWARLATSAAGQSGRVRLPGLKSRARYRLRVRDDLGLPSFHQTSGPGWLDRALKEWVDLPGAVLATVGLPLPTLNPQQALLLEIRRTE